MNNNERRIAIEAYNTGYANAMISSIEADAYAESDAMEDIGLKTGRALAYGGGWLTVGPSIGSAIYEAFHNAAKKKSTVSSVNALTAIGFPANKARQEFGKTVKFFKSKGYLSADFDESRQVLMYSDLNENGKEFMDGYYNKMDGITEFTIEKAIRAKAPDKDNAAQMGYTLNLIAAIASAVLIPLTFGLSIVATIISAVLVKYFKKEKEKVEKFENTKINESANIFDPSFFEE